MGQSLLLQSGLRRTVGAVVAARARRSDQRSGLLCQRGWPSSRRWCTTKKSGLSSTKSASSRAVAIASSCVSNSDSSAVFVTLPVATIRSRCWDLFNRWPFRKSRSFRDHDPSLLVGQLGNSPVGCAVPSGNSVVCSASCPASLRNWASRADSWALTRKFTRRRAGTPGGHPQRARELECGEEVVTLEVWVVGEHLLNRHACRQNLQQGLDRIAQTSHRRLAVADRRVGRNALQTGHTANGMRQGPEPLRSPLPDSTGSLSSEPATPATPAGMSRSCPATA